MTSSWEMFLRTQMLVQMSLTCCVIDCTPITCVYLRSCLPDAEVKYRPTDVFPRPIQEPKTFIYHHHAISVMPVARTAVFGYSKGRISILL